MFSSRRGSEDSPVQFKVNDANDEFDKQIDEFGIYMSNIGLIDPNNSTMMATFQKSVVKSSIHDATPTIQAVLSNFLLDLDLEQLKDVSKQVCLKFQEKKGFDAESLMSTPKPKEKSKAERGSKRKSRVERLFDTEGQNIVSNVGKSIKRDIQSRMAESPRAPKTKKLDDGGLIPRYMSPTTSRRNKIIKDLPAKNPVPQDTKIRVWKNNDKTIQKPLVYQPEPLRRKLTAKTKEEADGILNGVFNRLLTDTKKKLEELKDIEHTPIPESQTPTPQKAPKIPKSKQEEITNRLMQPMWKSSPRTLRQQTLHKAAMEGASVNALTEIKPIIESRPQSRQVAPMGPPQNVAARRKRGGRQSMLASQKQVQPPSETRNLEFDVPG